jgi:hypothetical protein
VGRWALVGCLLLAVGSAAAAVAPLVFPSPLYSRGERVARAWLRKDADEVRRFTEPSAEADVPQWLERNPPPDLGGQEPAVRISIDNDDGKSAEVMIQFKGQDKAGKPANFVFRHRWVQKDGTWYFRPPTTVTAHAPAGPTPPVKAGRGRRP